MPAKWIVGLDPHDAAEQGYIVHLSTPRFIAKWTIEDRDRATLSDLVYTDADEEDAMAIYDFDWLDPKPGEQVFRATMGEAIGAVDAWLDITRLD